MVTTKRLRLQTRGRTDIINITSDVQKELTATGINSGIATIFVAGSTAGVTTVEYEPALVADLKNSWQKLVPDNIPYQHDQTWVDANAYSHVRASLLGGSLVVPFSNHILALGTWQQIIIIDFDNRPRSREIILQFLGE